MTGEAHRWVVGPERDSARDGRAGVLRELPAALGAWPELHTWWVRRGERRPRYGQAESALLVRRTLRCGQRVQADGSVVVLGDVNPGAEVVARGDILVLGTLRGIAHAGASGDRDAVVAAIRLMPLQLRIADIISRPPDGESAVPRGPEVALIRDGMVVIERYGTGLAFGS